MRLTKAKIKGEMEMKKAILIFTVLVCCLLLSVFIISCDTERDIGGVKGPDGKVKETYEGVKGEGPKATPGQEASKEKTVAEAKGDPAKGKTVFMDKCSPCHGPEGKGDGPAGAAFNPKPRNLTDASYMSTLNNEHLFKVISEGGASVGRSPLMPAWGGTLSKDDIWNVIAHIRQDVCKCEYKGK
jgi:mono/diheme cytochrome c family protein/predicted small secreted protein